MNDDNIQNCQNSKSGKTCKYEDPRHFTLKRFAENVLSALRARYRISLEIFGSKLDKPPISSESGEPELERVFRRGFMSILDLAN